MNEVGGGPPTEPGRASASGHEDEPSLAAQPVADFIGLMSSGRPAPAAGSAAAVAVAMGAALAGKTARLSHRYLPEAGTLTDVADALRDRALALAEADAAGVTAAMSPGGVAPSDLSDVPQQIGELAGEVAQLATWLSEKCNPRLHADALAARYLAEGAQGVIDGIVRSNLPRRG